MQPHRAPSGPLVQLVAAIALLALAPLVVPDTGSAAASLATVAAARPLLAQQRPTIATRHIHGVVEDGSTGQPVVGATITVMWTDATGEQQRQGRSDRHGHVDFRDLPPRRVVLRARMLGYAPFERALDLTEDDVLLKVRLEPAAVQLRQVAVTADTTVDALERVVAVTSLDRAALDATRGQTLGETLKQLPGMAVIQLGPSIAKPVIRGLNSQRVLVLNAGLRQEDQQWGTEHAPNLDSFDADAVTVVRGAGTVLYGADALGGVVRVDHAPVADSGALRGDVAFNTFTNSRQGAVSVAVQGGGLSVPLVGRTGYRLRLTSRVAGNGGSPDYFLSNTGFRELNGSATFGVQREWGRSELLLSRFGTELGVLRQAHAGNFDDLQRAMTTPPRDSAFTYDIDRPNQRVSHTTLRWTTTRVLDDASELEVVYGLQYNHRREYDNHGPLRFRNEPAFNLKLYTNALDVRWKHAPWRGLFGTVGVSGVIQGNQTLGKAFLIPGFDLQQGAIYAQEEWGRGRLSISSGLRGDVITQTTLAFDDAGIRSPASTKSWRGIAGSFGAAYQIADGWDASLRMARAWRPPTVNERYAQGVHHGTAQYELGDATLDQERSTGVEAGVRYAGTRGSLDVSMYQNYIDDFIFLRPREPVFPMRGAFPAFNYARTDARMRGLELAGTWRVTPWLALVANATAVRGTDRLRAQPLYDMPADRALVQARVTGTHARVGSWYAGLGTQLVREQDGVPEGTIYTLPTAGYALLQAEVGTNGASVLGRTLDVSLSVSNALDTRYRDYLSRYRLFVDDAGRDVVLRVRAPLW
jgi:iron complex outermembrane recepter protein